MKHNEDIDDSFKTNPYKQLNQRDKKDNKFIMEKVMLIFHLNFQRSIVIPKPIQINKYTKLIQEDT